MLLQLLRATFSFRLCLMPATVLIVMFSDVVGGYMSTFQQEQSIIGEDTNMKHCWDVVIIVIFYVSLCYNGLAHIWLQMTNDYGSAYTTVKITITLCNVNTELLLLNNHHVSVWIALSVLFLVSLIFIRVFWFIAELERTLTPDFITDQAELRHQQKRRSTSDNDLLDNKQHLPHNLYYEFKAFKQKFRLNLTLDNNFVSPYLIVQRGNRSWVDSIYSPSEANGGSGCYYSGVVNEEPSSVLTASLCDPESLHDMVGIEYLSSSCMYHL